MNAFDSDIEPCLKVLQEGGIILYPTDTIWGLGCDATNAAAVQKIFTLKQREESKSLIVLVADERDVLQYVAAPDMAVFDYLQTQERPTTVIYPGAIGLAENLVAADGSVGIRICHDPFCRHLIRRLRRPLVSTSANISGSPSPTHFASVEEVIKKGVDYVVNYRQNDTSPARASSIIAWDNGQIRVIRP
jgi:L-threonylcarbamoyladenylate synthase